MYHPHPSSSLQRLFRRKPYQGADPASARYLFVGLDANFHPTIEQQPIFSEITAYLENGVRYWETRGFHHPFLHSDYRGDGQTYHRQFARIGFSPHLASQIAFVELLSEPTSGRSALKTTDLDTVHLERLSAWILEGEAKHVFMPPGVVRLARTTTPFSWLSGNRIRHRGSLPVLWASGSKQILSPYHFSCVGKHCPQSVREQQLRDIGDLMTPMDIPAQPTSLGEIGSLPQRTASRYVNHYRNFTNLDQLLAMFENAGMEAMESKNPKLAQSRYELTIELYYQILSLKPRGQLKRTVIDAMTTVAKRFPGQKCMNEALQLCELSNTVDSLEEQRRYLLNAKSILEQGLTKNDVSYEQIRTIYDQVAHYVELVNQRLEEA